jgi:hypothetical protein
VSTGNAGNAQAGQGSTDLRLSTFDRQRDAALRRPAKGKQSRTREGRGCYRNVSQIRLRHGSDSTILCLFFKQYAFAFREGNQDWMRGLDASNSSPSPSLKKGAFGFEPVALWPEAAQWV